MGQHSPIGASIIPATTGRSPKTSATTWTIRRQETPYLAFVALPEASDCVSVTAVPLCRVDGKTGRRDGPGPYVLGFRD